MSDIFTVSIDADGIAVVMIDAPGRSMNVIDDDFIEQFSATVDALVEDPKVTGVVFSSGKASFLAGADLMFVEQQARAYAAGTAATLPDFESQNRVQRKLETAGKPVAAAINGTALGGGFELCLACHYRVCSDNRRILVGLPEVTVGLLPGGGGTQRLPRLLGIEKSLPFLLRGVSLTPDKALQQGFVDAVVPADQLIDAAKAWVRANPGAQQPWDKRGFVFPGGGNIVQNPGLATVFTMHMGQIQRAGNRNFPAPIAILSCVFEGAIIPFDRALVIESQYFRTLFASPVAANVIRTNFVNKGKLDKLMHRPDGFRTAKVECLGVLGAGMMGAGIAYVSAVAGMKVHLLDVTMECAERGVAYARRVVDGLIKRGEMSVADADAIMSRILPTTDYAELADCDFIVEAVYEDRAIKADVTAKTAHAAPALDVFGSNTSTLPITGLAEAYPDPTKFIGIHFFSPVERMQLVEIIPGDQTSPETLARAFDYVRQIRKTPILVRDRRGFYTSRVFGTYLDEGMKMVMEGINPALVENAGRMAGMPVGPLTLQDEISFELSFLARNQNREDQGTDYVPKMAEPLIDHFYSVLKRLGKKTGAGLYDYHADGSKSLWPGLTDLYPLLETQPDLQELAKRFLYIQAVETVRCLEEGVLVNPIDGDVGAVLGWSFAAHTGGPFSMIDTIGVEEFLRECHRLAQQYGHRFNPPRMLEDMADAGRCFYEAA